MTRDCTGLYRKLALLAAGGLCLTMLAAAPATAQTRALQTQQPNPGMEEAAKDMSGHARLKNAAHQKIMDTVSFIAGNMLFVLLHETGHALVTEMGLPVLGREEDAAGAYATVTVREEIAQGTSSKTVGAGVRRFHYEKVLCPVERADDL